MMARLGFGVPGVTNSRNANHRLEIWGCIRFHGPGELVEVVGGIDRHRCIDIFQENQHQSVKNIFGDSQDFVIRLSFNMKLLLIFPEHLPSGSRKMT